MNTTRVQDKTRLFLGLQDELRAGKPSPSADLRVRLEQAAANLSIYFENPDCLPSVLGAGGLRYEHSFLQHNQSTPWIDETLRTLLAEFRAARNADANLCFQTWGIWMEAIDRAIGNAAVVAFLQQDIDQLSAEFVAKSVLRDVGDILEGSIQPLTRLRLAMQGVAGIRRKGAPSVATMTFGQVVEELASRQVGGDVYRPEPSGVLVSQWRNISHHNSYVVEGDKVRCTYGKPGHPKKVLCSVNDLIELLRFLNSLGLVHKAAFEIFSIDNMKALIPFAPNIEITNHTTDGALAYGLDAAGFTIVKVGYKPGAWALGLIDDYERNESETKAALQGAMTTYILWAGPVKVLALIESGGSVYKFSFRSETAKSKPESLPDSGVYSICLDRHWRPMLREDDE